MHYYKFNVSSWAKDTSHLSLKEECVYLRLINYYYDTEKPIPLKTHLVLRKLRVTDESETVKVILEEFFTKTKEGWIHNHCDKLISEYQKMSQRNKKNAKLGGRPKNKDLKKPTGFTGGNKDGSDVKPKGMSNQELMTNNYKPIVSDKKESLDWSATQMNESEIKEIKQLRRSAKAPITQRVIDQLARQFQLSRNRGYSNADILNEWSVKGWRAYKDEWMKVIPTVRKKVSNQEFDHEAARQAEIEAIRRDFNA